MENGKRERETETERQNQITFLLKMEWNERDEFGESLKRVASGSHLRQC